MKDILLRYQLNLDMCRGQCYNGASNILGKSSSVTTKIFTKQPKANGAHCHAHWPSLSVKDITKNTKILQDTMIKYSPKRENILGRIKKRIECENDGNNLLRLSETRACSMFQKDFG